MKPTRFAYHAPTSVDEVVELLGAHADEAKVLAGGQSLVPMMSLRLASFGHLVDINRVAGLDAIDRSNGEVRVGALVRQSVAEYDPIVAADVPLVHRALPHVGHFQIRNRGTIGGSVAHADPASELPAVAVALDATVEIESSGGGRTIGAAEFFESRWQTALGDDELLTAVRFPVWDGDSGFAVEEVTRRRGDFALAGAVCGVTLDGDAVSWAAIALFGVASTPVRAADAEQALLGSGVGSDLVAIGREAASPLDPTDDIHASGAYRKKVAAVLVRRGLARAIEEAQR